MRDLNIIQTIIIIIIIYSLFILLIINRFIIRNIYFTFYNKRVIILVGAHNWQQGPRPVSGKFSEPWDLVTRVQYKVPGIWGIRFNTKCLGFSA